MRRPHPLTLTAVVLGLVLVFGRLGSLPLLQPDEGRNAEVAREMKVSGAWFVPSYNGLPCLDKPAFYFKAVALSLGVLGDSPLAARLPSALFALGLLAMLWAFLRRVHDERSATLGVMVTASVPLFLVFGHMVIFDMALAFFVSGAILAGWLAEQTTGRARRAWWLAGALAAGLAVLVKGPVGFVVPSLVLLATFAQERRWGAWRRFFAPANLLVFVAAVLPWLLAVNARRPDFLAYGLVQETFRRYTTDAFHRTAPWYYYAPVTLGVLFPWSVLLLEGAPRMLARWRRLAAADRLLAVWAVVVVLFFSTSHSKLPGYILSGAIAAAALVGRLFALAWSSRGAATALVRRATALLAVIAAVIAALAAAQAVRPGLLQHAFGIGSLEFDRMGGAFLPAAISLAAVAMAAAVAAALARPRLAFAAFLLFPLSLLTVTFGGLRQYAEASSARALAARVPPLPAQAEVACLKCFPNGLPFYLGRTLTVITEDGRELSSNYIRYSLRRADRWPAGLVPLAERDRWLAGLDRPVYLLARSRELPALREIAAARAMVPATAPAELLPGWYGMLLTPTAAPGAVAAAAAATAATAATAAAPAVLAATPTPGLAVPVTAAR